MLHRSMTWRIFGWMSRVVGREPAAGKKRVAGDAREA
jgi:hypothetical protein